jgi:hypothetical protein
MDPKHKGARSELIACTWLLKHGYEVFRNISQFGFADLVAVNDNEVLKIDVKTGAGDPGGIQPALKPEQITAGVVALYVFPGNYCELERNPRTVIERKAICQQCGQGFLRKRYKQYCSKKCRARAQYLAGRR